MIERKTILDLLDGLINYDVLLYQPIAYPGPHVHHTLLGVVQRLRIQTLQNLLISVIHSLHLDFLGKSECFLLL